MSNGDSAQSRCFGAVSRKWIQPKLDGLGMQPISPSKGDWSGSLRVCNKRKNSGYLLPQIVKQCLSRLATISIKACFHSKLLRLMNPRHLNLSGLRVARLYWIWGIGNWELGIGNRYYQLPISSFYNTDATGHDMTLRLHEVRAQRETQTEFQVKLTPMHGHAPLQY